MKAAFRARLSLQNVCLKVCNSLERKRALQNVPLGIQKSVFPSVNCAASVTKCRDDPFSPQLADEDACAEALSGGISHCALMMDGPK